MGSVLVIGSSNTDMVINLPTLPRPGETISNGRFQTFAGGKGCNQAIAARRAGAQVRFVAAVGDDDFGRSAIALCSNEGIDTSAIQVVADSPSGIAMIFVDETGENCIGVAPGANQMLTPNMISEHATLFDEADVLLIQLETPIETVSTALQMARDRGLPALLNPAPAARLPNDALAGLYCITPNESEAQVLTGMPVSDVESAIAAADALRAQGIENVIVTLGSEGAVLRNNKGTYKQDAESVTVVDTTGAGDTLNGVFAAMIAKHQSLHLSIERAVAAATQSVQIAGATASIPYLSE